MLRPGIIAEFFERFGLFFGLDRDRLDHAGPGEWRDAVGAHILDRAFHGDNAAHAGNPHFGSAIVRLADLADQAAGRGKVHHRAGLLLPHRVNGCASNVEAAL